MRRSSDRFTFSSFLNSFGNYGESANLNSRVFPHQTRQIDKIVENVPSAPPPPTPPPLVPPRKLQNSHQPAAASRGFEQRQHIRNAEQIQNLLARVQHFQPAAPRPRRNVQRHHRSQSRTIHHRDFLQVQHDTPFSLVRLAHRLLQQRHILTCQPPEAFHHRAILRLSPLH